MQGMSSGSLAVPAVVIIALNGNPILFWIAIITIVLATIFFVYAIIKRRKEAREARAAVSQMQQRVT
jgi:dolichyl-phosphate-mannose--protein O-mannosyl transferase